MQDSIAEKASTQPEDASHSMSYQTGAERFHGMLDGVVRDSLRPVLLSLGALYVLFAISHASFLLPDVGIPMFIAACITAVALLTSWYALSRWRPPLRWVHPLSMVIVLVVLVNCLLHLYLLGDIQQTTNTALLIVGIGCFFLSNRWLGMALVVSLGSWVGVSWLLGPPAGWIHFAYTLVGATVLSVLVHTVRMRVHRNQFYSIEKLEKVQQSLFERTSQLQETVQSMREHISEREWAQAQLLKFYSAVNQSASSIIITDAQGKIEFVNPRFTQITGYSPEEAAGKTPRILKSGEKSPEEYEHLWNTITAGKEWRGEFHNKRKNGELFWVSGSISPIKNTEGVITHFIAVEEDISKTKKAEETIRGLAAIVESSDDAIIGETLEGIVQNWNSGAERMYGYSSEEMIG
ncbi:MAG: PAS domain S-box protein, partial [bacterium]